jgi:hypothetical protein
MSGQLNKATSSAGMESMALIGFNRGLLLLLVAATIFGAWFATCGPGLSHIGLRIILAFLSRQF